jgi:hypothetical protein
MKRLIVIAAALCALAAVPTASAGGWLSIPAGKQAIKSELSFYQVGVNYTMKVDLCYKPKADRVSCYFQTRESFGGGSYGYCYGVGVARERYGWTSVKLGAGWIDDCFIDRFRPFL